MSALNVTVHSPRNYGIILHHEPQPAQLTADRRNVFQQLDEAGVRRLCLNLLNDLKAVPERLDQNRHHSSHPPSSDGPFGGGSKAQRPENQQA